MSIQDFVLLVLTFCSIPTVTHADSIDGGSLEKIGPNWEKREDRPNRLGYLESVLSDLSRYELNKANENSYTDIYKRRPGWGKRSFSDDLELNKRRPGWGKRTYTNDFETFEEKRAPGWGKRSYGPELSNDVNDEEIIKRRPGWGKRSEYNEFEATKRRPGWGKRAPGWGKRSSDCQTVINDIRVLRMKIAMLTEDLPEACPSVLIGEDDDINNS
ncbi:APGW-amide-related neuropeptide-like [Ruditapes philippinarum]|uniref:APGW-amide-related neuropeptide-like n=1 Tax=Ruditapes philippinarum TaxID=129788 RepID=UPI00295AB465|nr:APGW-amide-related neuropeptide-like [Ruditapes philippinarum]